MTQTFDTAVSEIVNVLKNVNGIQSVPLNPPAVKGYPTFGLVYPESGNFVATPTGTRRSLHNIGIYVLTTDIDPARVIARLRPLVDDLPAPLNAQVSYDSGGNVGQRFNGSIETFAEIQYNWLPLTDYGGVPVLGIHFVMVDVKLMVNL